MTFSVSCGIGIGDSNYEHQEFASPQAAWATGKAWEVCEGEYASGSDYTSEQVAATHTAGYASVESVDTLYGLCASTGGFYITNGPINEGQAKEVAGMLMLCPDFPAAEQLRAASAAAQQAEAERLAGLRFWGSGVYVVGVDVQPGTFQSTGDVTNCYWGRLDAAGEIIDNNFIAAATQVQITIKPSDFSLDIQGGCGEFVKIG
jgi:hypothetical protein